MAKNTPKKVADEAAGQGPEAEEKVEAAGQSPEAKKEAEKAPESPKRTEPKPLPPRKPLITFERWFGSKKLKPHWKEGMAAFTNTNIRRTVEAWDAVFKGY